MKSETINMDIDFQKMGGLVPAVIQDELTGKVLMLGFMNEEALARTEETRLVTFFSRTRGCLWTKGETSGNLLHVVSVAADCDRDTLLVKVRPEGPVCHTGADTCWGEKNERPRRPLPPVCLPATTAKGAFTPLFISFFDSMNVL